MKTSDIAARVTRFRRRVKPAGGTAVQAEARHAAIAAAAGKRLGAHARPTAHGPATAGSAQAARIVAARRRFLRARGG